MYYFTYYPIKWEFQTSLDNINWYVADYVESSIIGNKLLNQFAIQPTIARYFRFVNKGNNAGGDSRFHISEVDIYG